MSRATPFAFCRYELAVRDDPLSTEEQLQVFRRIRGRAIAYRKADPTPADENTFLMKPKRINVLDYDVLTWE